MRIQIKEHLKNNNALFVIIETEPKEFFVVYSRLYPTSESPDDIYQVIKTEHELKPKKIKAFFEKEKENFKQGIIRDRFISVKTDNYATFKQNLQYTLLCIKSHLSRRKK